MDEQAYADVVALCQFLPGPASSQVGLAIGLSRAGYLGALAAWTGFTLPSAIALVVFAYGVGLADGGAGAAWLQGLKIAAVAVVAQAVLGMMQTLTPDRERATLAAVAAVLVLAVPGVAGQLGAILLGAVVGLLLFRHLAPTVSSEFLPLRVGRKTGAAFLALFFACLFGLPFIAAQTENTSIDLVDSFYRAGALVFGGGHVVLPLLQAEVVPAGWVTKNEFLAGYGAAQAVPGPLFTFAAYLGAVIGGWGTAALCLIAVFLPSFLLVFGALPFWEALRCRAWSQSALMGVNAAVVGLLLAALYDPVFTAGITSVRDFSIGVAAFVALFLWKAPPWLVVLACAVTAQGSEWWATASM